MNHKELIERLSDTNKHTFALWFDAADAIESLLTENERLKAELAKYSDAPVVVWRRHPFDYGIGHEGVYASTHFKEQSEVWKRKGWRVEELIIKPGE